MPVPTMELRFVERDGRMILQQKWFLDLYGGGRYEWKDIPVAKEKDGPFDLPKSA